MRGTAVYTLFRNGAEWQKGYAMQENRKNCSVQCAFYAQCATETRVLLNYCGANHKTMGKKIHDAYAACAIQKNLQGRTMKAPQFRRTPGSRLVRAA